MKNKKISLIFLASLLVISLTACSKETPSKPTDDISKNQSEEENTEAKEENIEVSKLFKDAFEPFSNSIGTSKFKSDLEKLSKLDYSIKSVTPTKDDVGQIEVKDNSGNYVSLFYYPKNDEEILALLTYNSNGYEVSIKNEYHKSSTLKYNTHNVNGNPKNKEVTNLHELKKFMFVEIGDTSSATSKELKVYINEKHNVDSHGKISFDLETNLPNDTNLMISLSKGDYTASTSLTVTNGIAKSESFSDKGNPLPSGEYTVEVTMPIPSVQSNEVRSIIGNVGENMTGDLVEESIGGNSNIIKKVFTISI